MVLGIMTHEVKDDISNISLALTSKIIPYELNVSYGALF